jgi:glycosyltransferase involved in cell wall biosynthesis
MNGDSLGSKLASQAVSLFRTIKEIDKKISAPLLFRPEELSIKFNTYILNIVIEKYKIDVVVNANAILFDIENISAPVIYDLVDDHLEPNKYVGLTESRVEKIKRDIEASRGIICVSEVLERKVKKLGLHSSVVTIENGVDLEKFRGSKSIKDRLGLKNKYIFGYIGGVERWTGIDRACEEYLKIADGSTAMIVVGDSKKEFFQNLKDKYQDQIDFVGQVSPEEVGNYFKSLDVGLIPFRINSFTQNSFPIKALEYGVSNVQVISTPLRALMEKNFPFIEFYPIEDFALAMREMKDGGEVEMDYTFDQFDWRVKTQEVVKFLRESIR